MGDIARCRHDDGRAHERPAVRRSCPRATRQTRRPHTMPRKVMVLQGGNVEQAVRPGDEEVAHRAEEARGQEPQELLVVGVCQNHRPNGAKHTAPDHALPQDDDLGAIAPATTLANGWSPRSAAPRSSSWTTPGFSATMPAARSPACRRSRRRPPPNAASAPSPAEEDGAQGDEDRAGEPKRRHGGERQPDDGLVPQAVARRMEQTAQAAVGLRSRVRMPAGPTRHSM